MKKIMRFLVVFIVVSCIAIIGPAMAYDSDLYSFCDELRLISDTDDDYYKNMKPTISPNPNLFQDLEDYDDEFQDLEIYDDDFIPTGEGKIGTYVANTGKVVGLTFVAIVWLVDVTLGVLFGYVILTHPVIP